jgi:hypothetical protein
MQDIAGQRLLGDAVGGWTPFGNITLAQIVPEGLRYTDKRCPFVRLLSEARRRSPFREPPLPQIPAPNSGAFAPRPFCAFAETRMWSWRPMARSPSATA